MKTQTMLDKTEKTILPTLIFRRRSRKKKQSEYQVKKRM